MINRKHVFITLLTATLASSAFLPAVAADDSGVASRKADQLVKAAQNYLSAADIRFEDAKSFLSASREFRKKEYATDKQRNSNIKTAGHKEVTAGNLFASAIGGYDKAAEVLSRAAAEYKKAGNTEQADELRKLAESTRAIATSACELSAQAYEASAEAFSSIDQSAMAASNEKAARMREALSSRIK